MSMLHYQGDHLLVDGHAVQGLADKLGTPFFLISEAPLRANYQAVARGLSIRFFIISMVRQKIPNYPFYSSGVIL